MRSLWREDADGVGQPGSSAPRAAELTLSFGALFPPCTSSLLGLRGLVPRAEELPAAIALPPVTGGRATAPLFVPSRPLCRESRLDSLCIQGALIVAGLALLLPSPGGLPLCFQQSSGEN